MIQPDRHSGMVKFVFYLPTYRPGTSTETGIGRPSPQCALFYFLQYGEKGGKGEQFDEDADGSDIRALFS